MNQTLGIGEKYLRDGAITVMDFVSASLIGGGLVKVVEKDGHKETGWTLIGIGVAMLMLGAIVKAVRDYKEQGMDASIGQK